MAGIPVTVHGNVRDASTGAAVDAGSACLTRGDDLIARTPIGPDGAFTLRAQDAATGTCHLTVLTQGLTGWRRAIGVAGTAVDKDVGTLLLRPSELPPGIHGQAWDARGDRPVLVGRVSLVRGGVRLATVELDIDGRFAFELTCRRPLPPGSYALVVDAPGYEDRPTPLVVAERITAYQLGRIELWPAEAGVGGP